MPTFFASLARLLEEIASQQSRLQATTLAADFLKTLEPDEVEPAVSFILGRAFQKYSPKTLEVSWATLSGVLQRVTGADWNVFGEAFSRTGDIGDAAMAVYEKTKRQRQAVLFQTSLTLTELCRSLIAIADAEGSGSREKKERIIIALLSQASPVEAKYLVKILVGEMRTGFSEGLMEQAVAKAFEVPLGTVQRASMALGDIGEVAGIFKVQGKAGLENVSLQVFRPVELMLAQVANNVADALKEHGGETAFEFKYDGARIQIHKLGGEVQIFSRCLTDVTRSLPEIVDTVTSNVKAGEAILEGEVVAVDSGGVPIPFQHLMRRFKRVHRIEDIAKQIPLRLFLFDVLYLDGKSLLELPYVQRRQTLAKNAGKIALTSQIVTSSAEKAEPFLKDALDAGHEGLMAKKLDSPYTPGKRGKRWLKVKPVLEPLDLVITAAEWGYRRRHKWLSDYYLAARDADSGEFLEIGKTFKGLTDAEMANLTQRLQAIAVTQGGHRVVVLPKIVVEVAYNEIQRSPKYKSRMALRFARITRIREDKAAQDADTIQWVRAIYERQFAKKGRYKTAAN
ncbi:MAG: ATP-dependent DNA ligase [Candidatus Bathyarchaeota archaeon]|nr:ATP-dependent DNA ligase [Candidatus Bathyarchaeota archaeon]